MIEPSGFFLIFNEENIFLMSRGKSGCEEAGESTIKRQKVEENGVRVFTKYKASTIVTAISCRSATATLKRDEKKNISC